VVFVERASPGILALVIARDRTGEWQLAAHIVGRDRWLVPIGVGGGLRSAEQEDLDRRLGQLQGGDDPLWITSEPMCGREFGVVLAAPDSTAVITPPPRIGADARSVPSPAVPLPLRHGGIAVFPTDPAAGSKVTVSQHGAVVAVRRLNASGSGPIDVDRLVPVAAIARAVREGAGTPGGDFARTVARMAAGDLAVAVADEPTGILVPWGGPVTDRRRALMVALTLPSGAVYVDVGVTDGPVKYTAGDYHGLLPAGQLGNTVLGWQLDDGLVVVVAPGAERTEVLLDDGSVLPVRLTDGGGGVAAPAGKARLIRAYRADGSLLGTRVPGTGLVPLPRT
jgi:hypothetical protein